LDSGEDLSEALGWDFTLAFWLSGLNTQSIVLILILAEMLHQMGSKISSIATVAFNIKGFENSPHHRDNGVGDADPLVLCWYWFWVGFEATS